ncbi:cell division protein FtsX [Patescibacteria group bacterium]
MTTFSITLVISLNVVGQQAISSIENKVDIDLYFFDYITELEILEVQSFFRDQDKVSQVVYVSKADALEAFKGRHAGDPAILASLEELDENVLPASLTVRTENIEDYPAVIEAFEKSEFQERVDSTDYSDNKDIISRISGITNRAYQLGAVVSLIFIVISVIVIFNTIRIAIYSHRENIGIMKLVGATNWFIRAPYILEGVLLGLIAACITLGLFFAILYISDPAITSFFEGYDFSVLTYFKFHVAEVVALEIAGAIVLSVVSSMVAITRYLRV